MIYEEVLLNLEYLEGPIKQKLFSDPRLLFQFNLFANLSTKIQFSYCCSI